MHDTENTTSRHFLHRTSNGCSELTSCKAEQQQADLKAVLEEINSDSLIQMRAFEAREDFPDQD